MKKLLLHLGLPKTATTTLQHHLFHKLDQEGKINFIGKRISFDERTGHSIVKGYSGRIIRKACEERLDPDIKQELDSILVEDRLNVFSDEGIMVCYPGLDNLPIERKLDNLKELLSEYEVTAFLTVRNPFDYFFSLYVQLYPDFYRKIKHLDSFEKCAKFYLEDSENILFETLNMRRTVKLVGDRFKLVTAFYEDLMSDPLEYSQMLAETLSVDTRLVLEALSGKYENRKSASADGVNSIQVSSLARFPSLVASYTRFLPAVYSFSRSLYRHNFLYCASLMMGFSIKRVKVHNRPSEELRLKVVSRISRMSDEVSTIGMLDEDKVRRYTYFTNNDM